jgi:hypothetical protein
MDEATKSAYKYVIYWALLRIRSLRWIGHGPFQTINIFVWWKRRREVRYAGEIAEWLHNVAAFSVHDFQGFSEARFWKDYDRLREKYPGGFFDFRDVFESRLHECRTGKWPTIEEQKARKSTNEATTK